MRNDVPAALPLLVCIGALTLCCSRFDAAGLAAIAVLLALARRPRAAIVFAAAAAGAIAGRMGPARSGRR